MFSAVYTRSRHVCRTSANKEGAGLIINASSIGGRIALPFNSLYHGTKFAIEGISESLALELAPHGIRVKIVEPGGVNVDQI
jgi:short-subunit dehydrogenase